MAIPDRVHRQKGRHARVDGIPFHLPVNSSVSPVLMAGFKINAEKAAELLPGNELHPVRISKNKALLIVTVIDYRETDIGKYIEYSIGIGCTHGRKKAAPLLPGLFMGTYQTGQYVFDLPVSSEISTKGGKGIWGMPKHQANLDFIITDDTVSSQYDKDGKLAMRIDIERNKGGIGLPIRDMGLINYCSFRGMLMKSYIYFSGKGKFAIGKKAKATLTLGDHPNVQPLKNLEIDPDPMFTAFLPDTHGVLDDYFECWFMTHEKQSDHVPEGLESVATLGLSEDWLEPPNRG